MTQSQHDKTEYELQDVLFKLASSGMLPHLSQGLVDELSERYTQKASTDPLIAITQEVKYTVAIKGNTFTFTQEEIDELAEELSGFTTL